MAANNLILISQALPMSIYIGIEVVRIWTEHVLKHDHKLSLNNQDWFAKASSQKNDKAASYA